MSPTFVLTTHGRGRMRERSLTAAQIDAALNTPETTTPGNRPGTKKYIGPPGPDGRRPVVVASDPPDHQGCVTIITCYFRSRPPSSDCG